MKILLYIKSIWFKLELVSAHSIFFDIQMMCIELEDVEKKKE